jgi:biofilm protein TabA
MALFGTLGVLKLQTQNVKLQRAINYLEENNLREIFESVSPGNNRIIEIEGKQVYAIFQEYLSKLPHDVKIEGHHKYIDIQYIFEGKEIIRLASEKDIISPDVYITEKDVHFPSVAEYSQLLLRKGDAAIFYPEDLHGPCCCIDYPKNVKKIVVKVAVY